MLASNRMTRSPIVFMLSPLKPEKRPRNFGQFYKVDSVPMSKSYNDGEAMDIFIGFQGDGGTRGDPRRR